MNKTEKMKDKIYSLVGNEFELLGEFINYKTKIKLKHNKCGTEFSVSPSSFIHQGKRCPLCSNESKGEKFIREYLENKGISFETQKTFKDCVYINKLRFDFYLNDFDVLIEYDGEQHFKQINYTKDNSINKENFENTKKRDKIKNDYCKEKKYKVNKDTLYNKRERDRKYHYVYNRKQEVTQGAINE